MKTNLLHYRTCVCNINYHMVWSVKYRKKVLTAEREAFLKEIINNVAKDKGFEVKALEVGEMDHVHVFVSAPPRLSITNIVKYLKGISGRKLFECFPQLRNELYKGELWNHSYYVETVGSISEDAVKRGLFVDGKMEWNADSVGAYNILRLYRDRTEKIIHMEAIKPPYVMKVAV